MLRVFLALAMVTPIGAGIVLFVGNASRPPPTLDQVSDLARSKRFNEAEAQGAAYHRLFPRDSRALLVLAEIALSRPQPDPLRALEYLDQIEPDSASLAAWVLVDRGNAYHQLSRFDRSEACWSEALDRDPQALESGRRLLDLLGLEGRLVEARSLALRQFEREPDHRERLKLLLRLARLDVDQPDPWHVIRTFEPAVRDGTADVSVTVACGLALVMVSRSQKGLPMLRGAVDRDRDSPRAWDALMTGLESASASREALVDAFARMPRGLVADARFAKHQGWLEQESERWSEAAAAYRRAWESEPDNAVGYRLRRTLRLASQTSEAERFDRVVLDYRDAFKKTRGLIEEADTAFKEGTPFDPAKCLLMAELRERMGRTEEASAWRGLAPVSFRN